MPSWKWLQAGGYRQPAPESPPAVPPAPGVGTPQGEPQGPLLGGLGACAECTWGFLVEQGWGQLGPPPQHRGCLRAPGWRLPLWARPRRVFGAWSVLSRDLFAESCEAGGCCSCGGWKLEPSTPVINLSCVCLRLHYSGGHPEFALGVFFVMINDVVKVESQECRAPYKQHICRDQGEGRGLKHFVSLVGGVLLPR